MPTTLKTSPTSCHSFSPCSRRLSTIPDTRRNNLTRPLLSLPERLRLQRATEYGRLNRQTAIEDFRQWNWSNESSSLRDFQQRTHAIYQTRSLICESFLPSTSGMVAAR